MLPTRQPRPEPTRMNENLQFLKAFLKNPGKVGAIAPSSPELAAEMLQGIEPDDDNIVLELGVGTGAITKYLQEIIPSRRSYLGIELDDNLVKSLKTKFDDLNIICGSAADAYRPSVTARLQHDGRDRPPARRRCRARVRLS